MWGGHRSPLGTRQMSLFWIHPEVGGAGELLRCLDLTISKGFFFCLRCLLCSHFLHLSSSSGTPLPVLSHLLEVFSPFLLLHISPCSKRNSAMPNFPMKCVKAVEACAGRILSLVLRRSLGEVSGVLSGFPFPFPAEQMSEGAHLGSCGAGGCRRRVVQAQTASFR